jgi:hypothetical protein
MERIDPAEPYGTCEQHCNHDLARGVTLAELLGGDGPYPPGYMLVSLSAARAAMLDTGPVGGPMLLDDDEPAVVRRAV